MTSNPGSGRGSATHVKVLNFDGNFPHELPEYKPAGNTIWDVFTTSEVKFYRVRLTRLSDIVEGLLIISTRAEI